MKINKITKKKGDMYEVLFDDLTKLNLYDDTLIKYNVLTKKEIDNKELLSISSYNNTIDAYYKAVKIITTKLRTKTEIEKKLSTLGYNQEIIKTTIERLLKEGYINDSLYIKSYINDQVNLSFKGPNKIRNELLRLKLKEELINEYLNTFEDDIWLNKINKIIDKKIKSNHNLSNVMFKNKLIKDIINMGYSSNMVKNKVANISINNEKEILFKEYQKELRKLSRRYEGNELTNHIKYNLYKKGFSMDSINSLL